MTPDQKNKASAEKVPPETSVQSSSALWTVVVLAILILTGSVVYDVTDDRAIIIRNEQERLYTQAKVVENNLESQVTSVTAVLRAIAKNPDTHDMNQRLTDLTRAMPAFRTLVILDKEGSVKAANLADYLQYNFRSREYFTEPLKQRDPEKLYVSPPYKSLTNQFSVALSVVIPGEAGNFDGVAVASFDPEYFRVLLNSVRYDATVWSSIVHGDGLLFMAVPEQQGAPGTNQAVPGTFFTEHVQSGRSENIFVGSSNQAGSQRLVAMRSFSPPGLNLSRSLIITVSRDLDAVLVDWRQDTLLKCSAVFGLSAMLLLGSGVLHVRMKKLEKIRRATLEDRISALNEITRSQELQTSYDRLELMQEVAQYHATNVQELLDFSLEKVISLTDSRIGYIYHYSEDTQQFELNTWSKEVLPACAVAEPQSLYQLEKTGIWGEVVRQRTAIVVNDFAAENPLKKGYPAGHVHLSRFLSIPIFDDDRIVAVVGVANKTLPYDQTDVLQLSLMMEGVWKIATRLKMEEQISRAGHEWQSTFDSINDSISLIDTEQLVIRCNRATSHFLGRDFGDILGQPCWKLFHGAEAPLCNCPMNRARLSLHSEISTIKHQDRWLEVTVDPIVSAQGEMTGAVHLVRDVTERVNLTKSIQEVNELFKLFMQHSPIYTYIKEVDDSESRMLQASDNLQDMVGIAAQDMIGKSMHELFPKEFADKITADDQQVVTTLQVQRLEECLNARTYITYKFPIERGDGKRLLAGYTIDITEQKQNEEAMRDMQTQIMQNDKLATIGQLAAGVAHEINNPMGFVGSNMVTLSKYVEKYNRYIQQLEEQLRRESAGLLPEHIQALRQSLKMDYVMRDIAVLVEESNEGIERVKRIVQDLRTFSRADSTGAGLANLNSCMDSTINIVINEIKYSAELKRDYGDIPKVHCNAQQINQIFMNLLINATHAIQAKGEEFGEIVVRTWCDQDNVFVSVSDNGCGIPPENQKRIFDAFFTTKEIGKGTGLGLSISSGIIRKHGGEITLTSELGVGSTFIVRLPLKQTEQAGEERQ